jgi:hypothetical protein
MGLRGTQLTGSIIYTLVNSPEILPELQIRVESQIFKSSTSSILDFFISSNLRLGLSTFLFIIMSRKGFWWTSLTTLMDQEAS